MAKSPMSKKTPGVFKASGKKSPQNKNSKKSQVPQSRFRRLMRGPLFWIIVAIAAVSIFGQISGAGNSY